MKKTYQIPSVIAMQLVSCSVICTSPTPPTVPFNPNPGTGVGGD